MRVRFQGLGKYVIDVLRKLRVADGLMVIFRMRCGCVFEYTGSYKDGFGFVNDADTLCPKHKRSLLRKLRGDEEWEKAMVFMEVREETYTTEQLKEKLKREGKTINV